MFKAQCVLPLVALYVGLAHAWDFAVSRGQQIEFYTNDYITDTVSLNSHSISALAYDEVHNMILYVDKQLNNDTICGHDLSSKENTCFIERNGRNIHGIAFDPTTLLIYFTDVNERSINYISLKARGNKYGNLFIKNVYGTPTDIVVESCRGYIYWINTNIGTPTIERASLDGLQRQVIINSKSLFIHANYKMEPHSLSIDQQTKKIYWIEPDATNNYYGIYNANLDGYDKTFLNHVNTSYISYFYPIANTLAVSKTFLFFADWRYYSDKRVFKLGKLQWAGKNHLRLNSNNVLNGIVANYNIKEQIQNINDCPALTYIHIDDRKKIYDETFCVHGTKLLGQALCKCLPGYSGERCEVSVCENYCFQGSCSVSDERLPKCSCRAGSSGDRCEVDICHGYCQNNGDCTLNDKSEPVCQCKRGHAGDRCEGSSCLNYCFNGNCSLKYDGLPQCRCDAGYSGERCEINMCHGYCQNNGDCWLNDKREPVCHCKEGYAGDRCEGSGCLNYCIKGDCSFNDDRLPQCRCEAGYSGDRCEVNVCHGYCLNDGVCSLNEADEASCECVRSFQGSRCEAGQSITLTLPITSSYSVVTNRTLTDLLSNWEKQKALVAVIVDES